MRPAQIACMNVPDGIGHPAGLILHQSLLGIGDILVGGARDHVEEQPLGALRLVVHELCEAFGRSVFKPLVHRQTVAAALADLLAVLIQEQLVGQRLGRRAAQDAADFAGQLHAVDQILARHLVIDAERVPAHRPVGLPLQLGPAARNPRLVPSAVRRISPGHRARTRIDLLDPHLHHLSGARMQRQDGRVGGGPLRAQGRQHGGHDRVVALQHAQQGGIEPAALVIFGGGGEFGTRSRTDRGSPEGGRCCARRSWALRCRTGSARGSAAAPDGRAAAPGSARCPAPCAARPCRR